MEGADGREGEEALLNPAGYIEFFESAGFEEIFSFNQIYQLHYLFTRNLEDCLES
jgi:hypothetical protein